MYRDPLRDLLRVRTFVTTQSNSRPLPTRSMLTVYLTHRPVDQFLR